MAKFCGNCGNALNEGTKFCGECGFKVAENNVQVAPAPVQTESVAKDIPAPSQETEKEFVRKEVLRIKCVGATTFQERLLVIYTDHIEFWKGEQSSLLFSETYDNIVSVTGSDSKIAYNKFFIHLKNGETFKFSPDIRYDLKGKYYVKPIFNTDIKQLTKTLPGYINKLIAEYKNMRD
ncbi:MAG: zinc ribbon domain-containing protein [Clostridia bacterium]|nr:zinc ribbon domain-containing protein [Clostridia bacterium]